MDKNTVALLMLGLALFLMIISGKMRGAKNLIMTMGFFLLISGGFASYANWLPQTRGEVPPEASSVKIDVDSMSTDKLAELGASIIFDDAKALKGAGKGQCPLCHGFFAGVVSERAPNLSGIPTRAEERIKSDSYKTQVTSVKDREACPGCGKATTAEEYIAESHSCPSCYVVPGYGVKGTNDKESPMPTIHKPPIELSIDEEIAVDTWLFQREGATPPTPKEIRTAYEKFIPPADRPKAQTAEAGPAKAGPAVMTADEDPKTMVIKMGCIGCHKIPTTAGKFGTVGPMLIEGTNAKKRISSPEYKAQVKAGMAHAVSPKEYIMESIISPSAFIVPGFAQKAKPAESDMPPDFGNKMTAGAISKLADFLLSLDEAAAKKDGMTPPKS